jgi:ribosomal 50S subunit-recycling heat shock protein
MGVTKTRMAAKKLCDQSMVLLGGKILKPSQDLLGGEILEILIPEREHKLRVLAIPVLKSVSKKDRPEYVEFLEESKD